MKKLPNQLRRIIKGERFCIDTTEEVGRWRGGLDVSCRITMVKADEEDMYESVSPLNNTWGTISVNLKVKGSIEVKGSDDNIKHMMEIGEATKTTPNYWGSGYSSRTDYIWGHELHKRVRKEIRIRVVSEVKNYLRIFGIKTQSWDGGLIIKKISFEK